jgi:hypothetical protein
VRLEGRAWITGFLVQNPPYRNSCMSFLSTSYRIDPVSIDRHQESISKGLPDRPMILWINLGRYIHGSESGGPLFR